TGVFPKHVVDILESLFKHGCSYSSLLSSRPVSLPGKPTCFDRLALKRRTGKHSQSFFRNYLLYFILHGNRKRGVVPRIHTDRRARGRRVFRAAVQGEEREQAKGPEELSRRESVS